MDKEFILNILNNKLTHLNDANILVSSYCEELGKPKEHISNFINIAINSGIMQASILNALEYYKKKFNITEVKTKDDNIILYY